MTLLNLRVREMVPVPGHVDLVVPYQKLLSLESRDTDRFHEVDGNGVLTDLSVRDLLLGLASEDPNKGSPREPLKMEAPRVFISYSHRDEPLLKRLEVHLKVLQRQGLVRGWHDRRIDVGDDWAGQISKEIESADIILLLVTADFLASDYCYGAEMMWGLERHERAERGSSRSCSVPRFGRMPYSKTFGPCP